jgi:regulatory protein
MTPQEQCYVAALRILGYRFNSELELRRKLQRKKFEKPIIDATIARLRDEKWLDDERFAGAFARTRARKRIAGKRIVLELRAAGINDDVAAQAVRENIDPEKEREHLRALIRRRPEWERNKLTAYLLKQGYDAALIRELIRDPDDQPDS